MSFGEQFFNWVASSYSFDGFVRLWGSVLFICLVLHIGERVRPAERNQSYRAMLTNGTIDQPALSGPGGMLVQRRSLRQRGRRSRSA